MTDAGYNMVEGMIRLVLTGKPVRGGIEMYDAPLAIVQLFQKVVPGTGIFNFVSNSQAKEAVAFQGMRLDHVSRIE